MLITRVFFLGQYHVPKEAVVERGTSTSRAALVLAKGIVACWGHVISLPRFLGAQVLFHALAVDYTLPVLEAGPAAPSPNAAAVAAPRSSWLWLPCFLQKPVMVMAPAMVVAAVPVIFAVACASLELVAWMKRVHPQSRGEHVGDKVLTEQRHSSELEESPGCLRVHPRTGPKRCWTAVWAPLACHASLPMALNKPVPLKTFEAVTGLPVPGLLVLPMPQKVSALGRLVVPLVGSTFAFLPMAKLEGSPLRGRSQEE